MAVYCDESGGIATGAMTFAAVQIEADDADALLERFRAITGHRGELKGSRIDLTERGLVAELFCKYRGRAFVATMARDDLTEAQGKDHHLDLNVYRALIDRALSDTLVRSGGCVEFVIDDGRYDEMVLERVRSEIARTIGQWGEAELIESHKSAGVQIADVFANSAYNLAIDSERAPRIARIFGPLIEDSTMIIRKATLPASR